MIKFSKQLIILAFVAASLTLGYLFIFKGSAKHAVKNQLQMVESQLEAKGDGSKLSYGEPEASGKSVVLKNIKYIDGSTQTEFNIQEFTATINLDGTWNGSANNLEITPANSSPVFIQSANLTGYKPTNSGDLNAIEFEGLNLNQIEMDGNISQLINAKMKIANLNARGLKNQHLESISINQIALGNNAIPELVKIEDVALSDVNGAELSNALEGISKGNIPLEFLALGDLETADIASLSAFMNNESHITLDRTDEEQLLDLFIDNAPPELKEILGRTDGKSILDGIEQIQKLPPEDQAIKGLELLLNSLKDAKRKN